MRTEMKTIPGCDFSATPTKLYILRFCGSSKTSINNDHVRVGLTIRSKLPGGDEGREQNIVLNRKQVAEFIEVLRKAFNEFPSKII